MKLVSDIFNRRSAAWILTVGAMTAAVLSCAIPATATGATKLHHLPAKKAYTLMPGEIALVTDKDGTDRVPVIINGSIRVNFVIDSGADEVQVTPDVYLVLARTGTVTQTDSLPSATYAYANGSSDSLKRFVIRTLSVGDVTVHDVSATVTNLKGGLLLGRSFLGRLSSWSIDNKRHVLLMNGPAPEVTATITLPAEPRSTYEPPSPVAPAQSESAPYVAPVTPPAPMTAEQWAWNQRDAADRARQFVSPTVGIAGQWAIDLSFSAGNGKMLCDISEKDGELSGKCTGHSGVISLGSRIIERGAENEGSYYFVMRCPTLASFIKCKISGTFSVDNTNGNISVLSLFGTEGGLGSFTGHRVR